MNEFIKQKEIKRKEDFLKALLRSFLVFNAFVLLLLFYNLLSGKPDAPIYFPIALIIFWLGFVLKRQINHGHTKLVSIIFISFITIPAMYVSYRSGALLPQPLILYALSISMTTMLLGTAYSFWLTLLISFYLMVLSHLQGKNIILYDVTWYRHINDVFDALVVSATFFIIVGVGKLYSRELKNLLNSLGNAKTELEKQKDLLEVRVLERTQELEKAQAERFLQLNRFAELGKVSSGLLHDISSPLTVLSLNLEDIKSKSPKEIEYKTELARAISSVSKLDQLIKSIKKQTLLSENISKINLHEEIQNVVQMFAGVALKSNVSFKLLELEDIVLCASDIKIYQLLKNLICNAMESGTNTVEIFLTKKQNTCEFCVIDYGVGISPKNLDKIFNPFFTTKQETNGTGLGLYICKEIVEKDLKGVIHVTSEVNKGTKFCVKIPIDLNC